MKRFAIGFVIGILCTFLFGAIFVFAIVRWGGEKKVAVPTGATLVVHLQGDLPERAQVDIPLPFFEQQQPLTMLETWQLFRKAAGDGRIKAIVLEPQSLSIGWAKMQELHSDIEEFRKSGKPVYAFLRGANARDYYVATAADRIYMSPEDELDVKGLAAQLMFIKGTLDKIGVEMEFEHAGKYKDAPDEYTRTSPTPETLEVINGILDQFYGNLSDIIANGRHKTPDEVRAAIDNGPFVGKSAIDNGFLDGLKYEDEVYGELKNQIHSDIKRIGERDYMREASNETGPKIAFVVGEGDITRGDPRSSDDGDSGITAVSMVKLLHRAAEDSSIKGVIFRIDSPGGDGIASDDILHAAKELSARKPLVISMSDLCASGGYFIAMTGDPIIAYPNTETGSIGVFFGKANLQELFKKVGVNFDTLKRGRFADIDSATRPLTEAEREKLKHEMDVFYHGFVERVAAGRKRPYDRVEALAQGRVWTGSQAKGNGLVDDLGGLDAAVALIKQRASIPASQQVTLVTFPPKRSVWDLIFDRDDNSANVESLITRHASAEVTRNVQELFGHLPMHALLHGGILAAMPYSIEVK